MPNAEKKSLETPDDTRTFEKGKTVIVNIGGGTVGRYTFEPGWKWSEHVKPIAGTDLCQASHFVYQISGRMHVVIPPGHDAWVVGNEPVEGIDWSGLGDYARAR